MKAEPQPDEIHTVSPIKDGSTAVVGSCPCTRMARHSIAAGYLPVPSLLLLYICAFLRFAWRYRNHRDLRTGARWFFPSRYLDNGEIADIEDHAIREVLAEAFPQTVFSRSARSLLSRCRLGKNYRTLSRDDPDDNER